MSGIKQAELVAFLRSLIDSIEQRGIVEKSVWVNISRGVKEGIPVDGWKTWKHTGEKRISVSFSYKEILEEAT